MKKTGKKKLGSKRKLTPKRQLANKSAQKKVTVKEVGKKPNSARRRPVRRRGQTGVGDPFWRRKQQRVRLGSQEICKACPMSKPPIRRVLMSCLRKETRLRRA